MISPSQYICSPELKTCTTWPIINFSTSFLSNCINTSAIFVKKIPVWIIQQCDFLNTLQKGKVQGGLSIVKKYFCLLIHCKREKQCVGLSNSWKKKVLVDKVREADLAELIAWISSCTGFPHLIASPRVPSTSHFLYKIPMFEKQHRMIKKTKL